MIDPKGAPAPFFFSLCSPLKRDDTLLQTALEAFQAGDYADALLAAEYVCRRYPSKSLPAILRAKILEACGPGLTARAWYRAWCCDPENPELQDQLMATWLRSGAAQSVAELGPAFLPARCRAGNHEKLVALLRQAGCKVLGACWRSTAAPDAIDGKVFASDDASAQVRLIVSNETEEFYYNVPANGSGFRIHFPKPGAGVWSLSLAAPKGSPEVLLSGSPIVACAESKTQNGLPVVLARSAGTHSEHPPVTIIIPVYRDLALVQACLQSVLVSQPQNKTKTSIIVIDDCSPEPALSAWLQTIAKSGAITLLRNPRNLGFIETVNRGMRVNPQDDVLLLNADTVVHGDWIDRLRTALYSHNDIASVTPWSNNGEISSFPRIAAAAPAPTPAQLAALDRTAARLRANNEIEDVEVPACCGFTLLMRRTVIDQIGQFDGEALIRGYNEEVDWCMRARQRGYRHLAATGVFVAHVGTVSFRFEKTLRVRQNRATVMARYPDYHPEYARFLTDDGLAEPRDTLVNAVKAEAASWLTIARTALDGLGEFSRALPLPLAGATRRVAVWKYRADMPHASKILELARLLAGQKTTTPIRLLIIGPAPEALWHTGVVDILPPNPQAAEVALLSDAALVGLAACTELLTESGNATPIGIKQTILTADFDPQRWLRDRLATEKQGLQAA